MARAVAPGKDAQAWLSKLASAPAAAVADLVIQAPPEASPAARWLLSKAVAALAGPNNIRWDDLADQGILLLRMVVRGVGTDWPGGGLETPHSRMLIGLGRHFTNPWESSLAYRQAAGEYRNHGESLLAALAELGEVTAGGSGLVDSNQDQVRARFGAVAVASPEAAAELEPKLQSFLRNLHAIAVVRQGGPVDSPRHGGLPQEDINDETIRLFTSAAWSSMEDAAVAGRLARVADELSRSLDKPDNALSMFGRALARQRRWPEAAVLLEECRARHPEDRNIAQALAGTWAESGRWDDARALLTGLLADPPGAQDVEVLSLLRAMGALQNDPEARHWENLLVQLDPSRTTASILPTSTMKAAGLPQGVVFRDGELLVSPELFELPEAERPVHMTAAVIAGSPDGPQLLAELEVSDQGLAGRVIDLLGIQRLTKDQARVRQHIKAGEQHFARRRFQDAAVEYQTALDIDPDEPTALLYLGDTCHRQGRYHLAQAYFEESIAVTPSPAAYHFLGDAISNSGGSPARARQCHQEALRLDPSYGGAQIALDDLNAREGQSAKTGQSPGGPDAGEPFSYGPTVLRRPEAGTPSPASVIRTPRPDHGRPPMATPSPGLDASRVLPTPPPPDAGEDSAGDRLVQAVAEHQADSVVPVIDDDAGFGQWLAAAPPATIALNIKMADAVAFAYQDKDRDLSRWAHWVHREVQLAEALPADFGPGKPPFEFGRDRLLSDAYASAGSVLYAQGRLPEAQRWWERAVELLKAEQVARDRAGLVGEPDFDRRFAATDHQAWLYECLARVCGDLGDEQAQQEYSRLAWQRNAARPTSETIIDQAIRSGDAALSAGNPDEALGAFHLALEQAEESGPSLLVPWALTSSLSALGRCHRQLGLQRSALRYHARARRLNERSGNGALLTYDFLDIGRVYRARPDLGDPRQALEQALVYTSVPVLAAGDLTWTASDGSCYRVTAADRAWAPLLELGGLLEDRGDLAAAVRFLDLAARIADIARSAAADDAQRVAIANQRFAVFAALTRLYLQLALAGGAGAQAAAEEAWRANEAMRARSFLDALGDDPLAMPEKVPAGLAEQEAAALERRRLLLGSGGRDFAFWDALGQVQADLDAIWDRMVAAAPEAAGYVEVRRSRPTSVASTRMAIAADPRPTVLASLTPLGEDQLAVLALRSDRAGIALASRPADVRRITRFISQNLGGAGRVRELAADLGDLFEHEMEPITAVLAEVSEPGDVLVVCPFGALNHLPLAALQLPDLPLVERNPLAVLPNASLIRVLRAALGTPAAVRAMVFGDPTGDLAGAREEAIKVGALYGVAPGLGPTASRAAVGSALTTAAIVHIAAHARFDAQDPLASGIRLADGTLSAREIITMSAPALSLVTLSACETAISQTNPAQELLGLTRALLFAGADSLLVSLWKVPDATTTGIMSDFYTSLHRGAGKADALQAAMLGARERYGAERFDQWAGFELIGEWR